MVPGSAQAQSTGLVRGLYGPEVFVREAGPTTIYTGTFSVPSYFEPPFTLMVENGSPNSSGKPDNAVSSAQILLNGEEISGPPDYNQNVVGFEREISVQGENSLEVRLNSKPGSFLTITITGFVRLFPMVEARTGHSDILPPDGNPLLHGGRNELGVLSGSESFDFLNFEFYSGTPSLFKGRAEHSGSILPDASQLIIGGEDDEFILSMAENFNPSFGFFTELSGELKIPRTGHTATTVMDGRVIVIGGRSFEATDSGEVFSAQPVLIFKPPFDPESGEFAVLQRTMTAPRWDHTATLLPDGMILITGGQNETEFLDSAELFDPEIEQFIPLASTLTQPRAGHTATLMPDGQVLILGGRDEWGIFPTAERYDPATQSFIPVQQGMILPRAGHTATLMPTGEVLVAGGENAEGILDTGELYAVEANDLIPPVVVETTPADGSEGVDLTEIIGIRFSEPVDVRTVTESSFQLTEGYSQPVNFTLGTAEEGLLVFLTPGEKLKAGYTFFVSIGEGVLDTAGNPLAPLSFTFETVPPPLVFFGRPRPGRAGETVDIHGFHFDDAAPTRNLVRINGVEAEVLEATIPRLKARIPWNVPLGPSEISVTTRGGTAEVSNYLILAPRPVLSSLSPFIVYALGPPVTLTINGSGFFPNSQVEFRKNHFSQTILTPFEITPNRIKVTIPQELLEEPVFAEITVLNPDPNYGVFRSQSSFFWVKAPTPTLSSISPSSAMLNGDGFTMTVLGQKFVKNARVTFDNRFYATTYISQNELRAVIPSTAISQAWIRNAKVVEVKVWNDSQAISASLPFEIQNPVPTVTDMAPTSGIAGYPNVHFKTLTINGSGFNFDTRIEFNGTLISTALYGPTQVVGYLPPSLVSRVGELDVRVINPAPGGGTSATLHYTALPVISEASPEGIHLGAFHRKVRITAPPIMPGASFEIEGEDVTVHSVTPSVTYTMEDNQTGDAVFSWMDASDGFSPYLSMFPIPFPFYLYNDSKAYYLWGQQPFITKFGLDFSNDPYPWNPIMLDVNQTKIPDSEMSPNAFIAPYWDDMRGGSLKYKTLGEEPNRIQAAQWTGLTEGGAGEPKTYQVLLEELTGRITFQYHSGFQDSGFSAAIGIEGAEGKQGRAYLVNGAPAGNRINNNLAVTFTPKKEFILDVSVDPNAPLGPRDVIVTLSRPDLTNNPVIITQEAVFEVVPSPTGIVITSPVTGSQLDFNTVMVEGYVPTTQDEIGVVVNGVIAHVSHGW
ncbi:MAG TPA: kelch repeat-containing protein, partial [Nitrospiria bacterium]